MTVKLSTILLATFFISCFFGLLAKISYNLSVVVEFIICFFLSFFVFYSLNFLEASNESITRTRYNLALFTLTVWLAVSILLFDAKSAVVQYLIYLAFLLPVLYKYKLSDRQAVFFVYVLIAVVALQLPFDLLFPNTHLDDPLDWYSGTFVMANNKSRFLGFVIPFLLSVTFRYKIFAGFHRALLFLTLICASISFFIGFSNISYIFIMASLILAASKRFCFVAIFLIVSFISFPVLVQVILDSVNFTNFQKNIIEYNFARYLDPGHGVLAVYNYGASVLNEMLYFFGTGLGQFSTRAAQMWSTEVNAGIPEVMVTYGTLSKASSPYGLSSFYVWIVEGGWFGLFLALIVLSHFGSYYKDFWTRYLVVYLLLVLLYSPVISEFSEFIVYFFVIVLSERFHRLLGQDFDLNRPI